MRLAWALALLLASSAVQPQTVADPIVLDVLVDDGGRGNPLTAADFTVTEAGEAVPVASARLVQPSRDAAPLPAILTDADEEAAASAADHIVGVYVDEYHLASGAASSTALRALAAFLRTSLGPRDLVVVLKPLDSLVSIRMTSDREAAAAIVEQASPREGDYTARSTFERNFLAGAPARIDATRNQIAMSALDALASHLGRFSAGRKTMIVLSDGIAMPPRPSRGEQPLPGLDAVVRSANRARVAIYPLRPADAVPAVVTARPASTGRGRTDVLASLADQTTGFVIDGSDNADAGLQRVLREMNRYYVLILQPADVAPDGRFREVTVAVRRSGTRVRARAGYGVPRPEPAVSLSRASVIPEGLKVPRHTSPLIRTWFGQASGAAAQTHVDFVWEPSPRVPGERRLVVIPDRVSMSVTTMDGVPVFSGVSSATGREGIVPSADHSQLSFDAKPGTLLVQMEVLDSSGKVLDRDVRDLVVSGFPAAVSLGTAAVYRARTPREVREITGRASDAAPVAARQFSRAEHLVVRVPVAARGERPAVTAELRSRFGAVLRDLAVTPVDGGSAFQVDLPLAPLASGGYMIQFSARAATGSAVDRVEFAVTP